MTLRARQPTSRVRLRTEAGVLLVLRPPPPAAAPAREQPPTVPANPAEGPEVLLAVWDDGSATALHGHVDLGTGLRTALGQLAAEELDLPLDRIHVLMGDTASVPNQGATIASASIQVYGLPLRQAAAQARAWLAANGGCAALAGRHVELAFDPGVPLKAAAEHRVVGTSAPRVDIPAKATGELVFVHDMRLPGMLHGRVVRPPYAGVDAGDFVGNTLESVDEASVAHLPGIVAVVRIRDFVGVVAEREEQADAAMRALQVRWKPWPGLAPLDDVAQALRDNPAQRRLLVDEGDVDAALQAAAQPMARTYVWPYQLHASIGPSCALADWQDGALRVWAGTQNPHALRADLARLTGLADAAVDLVRMEAAGCYGRNGADDVAADAALLSRAVGRPVRVQLTREQEHLWEPKGAAQLMEVRGCLDAQGAPAAYDFSTAYPSNGAPTLALLLTRTVEPTAQAYEMGDRTAKPPYAYPNLRVAALDMAPILRASWLRGVSALPNAFAHESYIDELATAAGVDPVEYRLRHLPDERAAELVRATAARAGWVPHAAPRLQADGDRLKGQGFAYARYVHSKWPGFGAAWAAWVADVEVDRRTGEVHVSRVVVGHDAGLMVNPAGVQHQVHGNVLQTTSRALKERVELTPGTGLPASRDWGGYPILNFREVPVVDVLLMPRPGEPPLGAGESASVPGTAAIANAIFDATGVRLREPPFTPEVVRAALGIVAPPTTQPAERDSPPARPRTTALGSRKRKSLFATAVALGAAVVTLGWRPSIAPVSASTAGLYAAETIERGRLLAAAGNCAVCHTAPGGTPYAGGRALDTPFGTVYATNLTPDPEHGIGRWSFSAFQRAMREGVSRDGHHLYPAFPYTAYTRATDDDLQALYAYLMSRPAVAYAPPKTRLAFPFNVRPGLAAWNALVLDAGPKPADPTRSPVWNRGEYLVNGFGHCGGCHTPRNALGAERGGNAYLAGATIDGWYAPPLTAANPAPVPWTEDAYYCYLRDGHASQHGSAAGPMGPVVQAMQALPDADVRAMAVYLASLVPAADAADVQARADAALASSQQAAARSIGAPQRLFEAACGACHHDGRGPEVFGTNTPLAFSGKLHADTPDALLRVLLEGLREPATRELGVMPAFADAYDDRQLARLAVYLRARFASDKPAWRDLEAASSRVRAAARATGSSLR